MKVRWYPSHALPSVLRCRFSSMRLGGRPRAGAALRAAGGGTSDASSELAAVFLGVCAGDDMHTRAWRAACSASPAPGRGQPERVRSAPCAEGGRGFF